MFKKKSWEQRPVGEYTFPAQSESGITTTVIDGCPPREGQPLSGSKNRKEKVKDKELSGIKELLHSSDDDYVLKNYMCVKK